MRSPILHLKNEISRCPFLIAPAREKELADLVRNHRLEIEIVFESNFRVRIDLSSGVIRLPVAGLEYLWACSFFFWVLYQEYVLAQRAGCTQFDTRSTDRLRKAWELFNWAYKNLNKIAIDAWPHDLPSPINDDADAKVANELFLCALSWIIHHEIAHPTLQHGLPICGISISEEENADKKATEWILGGIQQDDPRLKKRGFGVATAILTLQSLEVNSKVNDKETHPRAFQRLYNCLFQYEIGFEESIEAFVIVILQVLFKDKGIYPDIEGASFRDILSQFLIDISRGCSY